MLIHFGVCYYILCLCIYYFILYYIEDVVERADQLDMPLVVDAILGVVAAEISERAAERMPADGNTAGTYMYCHSAPRRRRPLLVCVYFI